MNDRISKRPRLWGGGMVAVACLAAAIVAGCGGGGSGGSGTTEQAAAATTSGPVDGFGSIIVNGVRFDDSTATIENEDGDRGSSSDIKLGTMVEVDSDAVDDSTSRARALRIRFGSEIIGAVQGVPDTTASTFQVLDQVVDVVATTVFDDSLPGGLAGLEGKTVEVHALYDAANGHYVATRVEDASGTSFFKLRGIVGSLDTTKKTFQLGAAVISYAKVADADLPANFADGVPVRLRMETSQVDGQWVATTIRNGVRKVEDRVDARVRGTVTAFTSTSSFSVNGIPVDASSANFPSGTAGLVLGARVDVRGKATNGTIVATRVKVLKNDDDEVRGIELHGAISAVDTTSNFFVLRGLSVVYADTVVFKHGSETQLVDGAKVEVKGVLSADRRTLAAVVIDFES